jgi:hypothetical protein
MYDLIASNPELKPFRMASDWLYLLAQCGAYFTCVHNGARWYMLYDERMTTHYHDVNEDGEREQVVDKTHPAIICNCGFEITAEEASVMARIARNFAAIQRTLEEPAEVVHVTTPDYLKPFPLYIRRDWIERYEQFAEWAEQSQGFKVF